MSWSWLDVRWWPKPLCHFLARQGRENKRKVSWVKIRRGRDNGQNRFNLKKLIWFVTNQLRTRSWEIKPNLKKHFLSAPPFFPGLTSLPNPLLPPYQWCYGMGAMVSSSYVGFSIIPSQQRDSSHSSLVSLGVLPEETQFSNMSTSQHFSSLAAPVWVPTSECSPLGTEFSSMGHQQHHNSWQQACSSMVSSLHRSISSARTLLHCRISVGSQSPLGILLLWHWALQWLQVVLWWTSMCCRDTAASPWTAPWTAEDLISDA